MGKKKIGQWEKLSCITQKGFRCVCRELYSWGGILELFWILSHIPMGPRLSRPLSTIVWVGAVSKEDFNFGQGCNFPQKAISGEGVGYEQPAANIPRG